MVFANDGLLSSWLIWIVNINSPGVWFGPLSSKATYFSNHCQVQTFITQIPPLHSIYCWWVTLYSNWIHRIQPIVSRRLVNNNLVNVHCLVQMMMHWLGSNDDAVRAEVCQGLNLGILGSHSGVLTTRLPMLYQFQRRNCQTWICLFKCSSKVHFLSRTLVQAWAKAQKILTNNITAEEHPQNLKLNYVGWNTCDCEETK